MKISLHSDKVHLLGRGI